MNTLITLAQTTDPSALVSIIRDGGVIAALTLAVWAFATGRIKSADDYNRALAERDASLEREREMRELFDDKILPLAIEMQRVLAEDIARRTRRVEDGTHER